LGRVADWTAFVARHNVPAGVLVFEWPAGKLDNAGEKIQLSMPGDVDLQGRRQWIRVDRVTYSDGSHPSDTDPWLFCMPITRRHWFLIEPD
jgi:hypothetical protein